MAIWFLALAFLPFVWGNPGAPYEYFDILGTGHRDWRLAFKGLAGVGTSVFKAYVDGYKCPKYYHKLCHSLFYYKYPCHQHYRNHDALDKWHNVEEVLFVVVSRGQLVKVARFNAKGTNNLNWFRHDRYLDSSWGDIGHYSKNFFSIEGDNRLYRRFFINHEYGGCHKDNGWFVAMDTPTPSCDWEKVKGVYKYAYPLFLYAGGHNKENWSYGNVRKADAILIFLRYTPSPKEPEESYDLYGSGRKNWRLAFRATSHIGASAYRAYLDAKSAPTLTQRGCRNLHFGQLCHSHYRNSAILDNWQSLRIQEVLVAVVDGGKVVKKVRFNGHGSTFLDWFSQERYLDSSWPDIATEKKNFFSIRADDRNYRRFFINNIYAGCDKDVGWLVTAENRHPRCSWEKDGDFPVIRYATGNTKENWTKGKVKNAYAFLIFVKILPPRGFPEEYFDVLGSGVKEWRLAFRGTANVGASLYAAYLDAKYAPTVVKPACKNLDFKWPCNSHYRNSPALDNWSNIQEVLVAIVDHGVVVKTIRFDGRRTTYLNWFGPHFFLESSWPDLPKVRRNFFSIKGDDHNKRRFFINNKYGGCPNDVGWCVVIERSGCPWEKEGVKPVIKYASGLTRVNWNDEEAKNADAILIFLKYPPGPGNPNEYFDILGCGLKEWRLAFRGTANVGTSIYDAYVDGKGIPALVQPACKNTDWGQPCHSHYRNSDALNKWVNVKEVLFGIIEHGALVKYIRFDGSSSTFLDWFDKENYIESSWEDIISSETEFFSIVGDAKRARRFFISFFSKHCDKDAGWVVAVDAPKPKGCNWEKGAKFPILKYAAGPKKAIWESHLARNADAFVVFIKYAK